MNAPALDLSSGKGHRDENFPVASWLLRREHRAPIMAFYRFARAADDIADHESAASADKLARLAAMRRGLDGLPGGAPDALALHDVLRARDLDAQHGHDLLSAFEQDVVVDRYATWEDLIDYCRLSAMPVGRFVLDVHREDRRLWPANDALCAALQIINHLQDCGKDYRQLRRSYLPEQIMSAHGANRAELGATKASAALLAAIHDAADGARALLAEAKPFAADIRDRRLAAEVRVIQRLAEDLTAKLLRRDPLSERVHHSRPQAALLALRALIA